MRILLSIILLTSCFHTRLLAQTSELTVIGLPDSTALPFAHVKITGENDFQEDYLTDNFGIVKLQGLKPNEDYMMSISFIGYSKEQQKLKFGSTKMIFVQPDTKTLEPVLITAEYQPVAQSNSMNVTRVIDSKQIEKMAAVNLKDALSNELNIKFGEDSYLGTAISMQGLSGENLVIMVDGVPVIGRQGGNIDVSQINMVNVERIEVIEGPTAVNYGSNAIAGTINIITKKNSRKPFHFDALGYYESFGQYNVNTSMSWKSKKHFISGSFARLYFDGWSPQDPFFSFPKKTLADTNRVKQWKPKEQYIGDISYKYTASKFIMEVKGNIYDEEMIDRGAPIQPNYEYAFDRAFKTSRYSGSIFFNGKIKDNWAFNVLGSGNYYQRKSETVFKDLTTLDFVEITDQNDTTSMQAYMIRGSFQYIPKKKKVSVEMGYDLNYNQIKGDRILNNLQDRIVADFFGSFNWNAFKGFDTKIGLRYGYNSDFLKYPVASIQLKYKIDNFVIRGSYAMGYRAPSLKEQYMYFVDINHNIQGNPELKEEKSHNAQLGLAWKKFIKEKHDFNVQLKGFYNFVYDQIDLYQVENSNLYSYFNNDQVQTAGVSALFSYKLEDFKFGVGVANQWLKPTWKDYQINQWLNYWEANAQITYTIKKSKTSFNLFYKFNGEQPNYFVDSEGNLTIGEIDDYHIMDFNISQAFWKKRIIFSVGAKNLFNVQNVLSTTGGGGAHSSGGGGVNVGRGTSLFTSLKFNLDF